MGLTDSVIHDLHALALVLFPVLSGPLSELVHESAVVAFLVVAVFPVDESFVIPAVVSHAVNKEARTHLHLLTVNLFMNVACNSEEYIHKT